METKIYVRVSQGYVVVTERATFGGHVVGTEMWLYENPQPPSTQTLRARRFMKFEKQPPRSGEEQE